MEVDPSSPCASSEADVNQPICISDNNDGDSKEAKIIKEMEQKISTKLRYSWIHRLTPFTSRKYPKEDLAICCIRLL